MASETDLYAPVKALLEGQGYEVKAEINGCDVVARKPGAPLLVVELKLAFSLDLVLQGVDRLSVTDDVYLAVLAADSPRKRKNWRARQRRILKLCRLVGLGLIVIEPDRAKGLRTNVLQDPKPYSPRKNKRRQSRLLREFTAREGDPNTGGTTKTKIVTAYRQDAVRCAMVMVDGADRKIAEIAATAGVPRAGSILQKNHYDWFERTSRGIYRLAPAGQQGLRHFAHATADGSWSVNPNRYA